MTSSWPSTLGRNGNPNPRCNRPGRIAARERIRARARPRLSWGNRESEARGTPRRCRCFLPFSCEPLVRPQTDARIHVPCPFVAAAPSDATPLHELGNGLQHLNWPNAEAHGVSVRVPLATLPHRRHRRLVLGLRGFVMRGRQDGRHVGRGSHPSGWAAAIFPPYEATKWVPGSASRRSVDRKPSVRRVTDPFGTQRSHPSRGGAGCDGKALRIRWPE
jgi:hypothetical protein